MKSAGNVKKMYKEAFDFLKGEIILRPMKFSTPNDAIEVLQNGNFESGKHYPQTPQGVGKWIKIIKNLLGDYNHQELFKIYDPMYTHNEYYWNSSSSPYQFTKEDKTYLNEFYREINETIYFPMFTEPRFRVLEAIWICRLKNMNPLWEDRPVDLLLWAHGFSIYESYYGYKSDVIQTAINYLNIAPFENESNTRKYVNLYFNKLITPNTSVLNKVLNDPKNQSIEFNDLNWFLDYPLYVGGDLHSYPWLWPHMKLLIWLHDKIDNWFQIINIEKSLQDTLDLEIVEKVNKILAIINDWKNQNQYKGMKENEYTKIPKQEIKIENDINVLDSLIKDKNVILFDISLFDRYYPLMINMWSLVENKGFNQGHTKTIVPGILLKHLFKDLNKFPYNLKFPIRD